MKDKKRYNDYQREYQREISLKKYKQWRVQVVQRLGSECVICHSKENLEIDHIDASLKTANFRSMHTYSKERQEKELENAQLLCAPCHINKTRANKEASHTHSKNDQIHGSGYMYVQKKCKCASCKIWHRFYKAKLIQYADVVTQEVIESIPQDKIPKTKNASISHGTRAGYLKEGRLRLERCKACKAANAEYTRSRKI